MPKQTVDWTILEVSKSKQEHPTTHAMRELKKAGVDFEVIAYKYQERGGTRHSAERLGVDEHSMVKTLIMEDDRREPIIVLMHGDREVATGLLARAIGVKRVQPCDPKTADRHAGYQVGGTAPLGTRRAMPVDCQASIAELPRIYINGGRRGYIISLATRDLLNVLRPTLVDAAH